MGQHPPRGAFPCRERERLGTQGRKPRLWCLGAGGSRTKLQGLAASCPESQQPSSHARLPEQDRKLPHYLFPPLVLTCQQPPPLWRQGQGPPRTRSPSQAISAQPTVSSLVGTEGEVINTRITEGALPQTLLGEYTNLNFTHQAFYNRQHGSGMLFEKGLSF